MDRVDVFIANLYQAIQSGHIEDFRDYALREMRRLVPFDAALWGSGGYGSQAFHSVATQGVDRDYVSALERTRPLNPMLAALIAAPGRAIDIRSLLSDDRFHHSPIYKQCFSHHGVERLVSYLDCSPQTGVHSLISLYRFDQDRPFSGAERALFERAAFHFVAMATHALFMHVCTLAHADGDDERFAICDRHGLLYQAEPGFRDLLERVFGISSSRWLPFDLPARGECENTRGLCVEARPMGDLFSVRIWRRRAIDGLAGRDRAIVDGVCRGMTFKDIGRELQLAPSTISNRLYRVYRELGVTSRSSLVRLIHGQG